MMGDCCSQCCRSDGGRVDCCCVLSDTIAVDGVYSRYCCRVVGARDDDSSVNGSRAMCSLHESGGEDIGAALVNVVATMEVTKVALNDGRPSECKKQSQKQSRHAGICEWQKSFISHLGK